MKKQIKERETNPGNGRQLKSVIPGGSTMLKCIHEYRNRLDSVFFKTTKEPKEIGVDIGGDEVVGVGMIKL